MKEQDLNADEEDENLAEADYSRKSDFSKARVVEDAIRKVQELRSQEMIKGYYNFITLPSGDLKKVYVPDSRKAFIGGVESLKSILAPESLLDDKMKDVLKEIEDKKEELFNVYSIERVILVGMDLKETGKKYIPEVDEGYPVRVIKKKPNSTSNMVGFTEQVGYWNFNVNQYWNQMVELYDKLFGELNLLVSRPKINYFKQKSGY